jgi:hypothetical protein
MYIEYFFSIKNTADQGTSTTESVGDAAVYILVHWSEQSGTKSIHLMVCMVGIGIGPFNYLVQVIIVYIMSSFQMVVCELSP